MDHAESKDERLHGLAAMRSTHVMAFLLPIASIGCLAVGLAIAANAEDPSRWMWSVYSLLGIAVGLVLAYFVVTLLRAHGRSLARTIISSFVAVLLLLSCGLMLAIDELAAFGIFGQTGPPPLASALQDSANQSAYIAAAFLESGDSGEMPSFSWTSRGGQTVGIRCQWKRNREGILVTASPDGAVPKGQSSVPRRAQALRNGMIGVDLDYYQQQGKSLSNDFLGPLFEPMLQFLGALCRGSVSPIAKWADEHGGKLPDVDQAEELLKDMKGKTFSPWPVAQESDLKLAVLKIDDVVYEPGSVDGIFDVNLKWIMKYQRTDASVAQYGTGTGSLKVTGTATGLIAIPRSEKQRLETQWMMQTNIEGADVEGSIWGATWKVQDLDPTVPRHSQDDAGSGGSSGRTSEGAEEAPETDAGSDGSPGEPGGSGAAPQASG